MTTPPIPPGFRVARNLPPSITLPSGQTAYLRNRRRGVYTIGRPSSGLVPVGPAEVILPSGQRGYRTSRGTYTTRRPRSEQRGPVNPRRVHFDASSGQYYESPSNPEQAIRNPERYGTYINRQVQRDPDWLNKRLGRKDRRGATLSNRLASQEIAAPGRYQWVIDRQRLSGSVKTVSVLVDGLGPTPMALTAIERSIVARHWNAVKAFLHGQENDLWRFRGIRVGAEGYMLMTDEFDIEETGNRGELDFESMYPVTYPVSMWA